MTDNQQKQTNTNGDDIKKKAAKVAQAGVGILGDLVQSAKNGIDYLGSKLEGTTQEDTQDVTNKVYQQAKEGTQKISENLQHSYQELKKDYREYRNELKREAGHTVLEPESEEPVNVTKEPVEPVNESKDEE